MTESLMMKQRMKRGENERESVDMESESGGHHLLRMEMRAIVLLKKAENK